MMKPRASAAVYSVRTSPYACNQRGARRCWNARGWSQTHVLLVKAADATAGKPRPWCSCTPGGGKAGLKSCGSLLLTSSGTKPPGQGSHLKGLLQLGSIGLGVQIAYDQRAGRRLVLRQVPDAGTHREAAN